MSRTPPAARMAILAVLLISTPAWGQTRVIAPQHAIVTDDTLHAPLPVEASHLPRNFDPVFPITKTPVLPVTNYGPPNFLVRPWYVAPYRYYSYYRPWYTYGYYGPSYYRYHYAPSWGYAPLPYYAPPYLSPGAYGPPDYGALYHW
jgi:hypothetical protein